MYIVQYVARHLDFSNSERVIWGKSLMGQTTRMSFLYSWITTVVLCHNIMYIFSVAKVNNSNITILYLSFWNCWTLFLHAECCVLTGSLHNNPIFQFEVLIFSANPYSNLPGLHSINSYTVCAVWHLHRGQIQSPWLGDKVDSGIELRSTLVYGCPMSMVNVLESTLEWGPIHHVFLCILPLYVSSKGWSR